MTIVTEHEPSVSRYHRGCKCDGCRDCAREARARLRQQQNIANGANEYCPVCDWWGFNVVRHDLVVHGKGGDARAK